MRLISRKDIVLVLTVMLLAYQSISYANNAPVFDDGESTTLSVAENLPVDTEFNAPLTATDADGDTLTYSIDKFWTNGTDPQAFNVDASTGQLSTDKVLNFERQSSYEVTVTVSDGNGGSDSITVTINVTDSDITSFLADETTRIVTINSTVGTNVGSRVSAQREGGATLTYTLGGTDAALFTINSSNGQLKTGASLDYAESSYEVTVTVTDENGNSDSITVIIGINNHPVFDDNFSAQASIAIGARRGTVITILPDASDPDGDILDYSVASGQGNSDFDVIWLRGRGDALRNKKVFTDADADSSHDVYILAQDAYGGYDGITITVDVVDAPNNAPVFDDGRSTTLSVAEVTASGTDIGSPLTATDADDDTLTYSLGGTDASSYAIDSRTGQLETSAELDYSTKNAYEVTVTVSDGNDGSDSITVTINVTEVSTTDNNAPVFDDGESTTLSVAEATASGTDIGSPLTATDADDDTLTYSLGGTDASSYAIDSSTGQLETSAELDYSTKNAYEVTVTVSDGNDGSDSITVTINVTEVSTTANNAPVFGDGESTTRSVASDASQGTDIGNPITATDADDDTLTYRLNISDLSFGELLALNARFSLDGNTGQLTTASSTLQLSAGTSVDLTITASDGNGGLDSITVTINVTEASSADNNAPVFNYDDRIIRSVAGNLPAETNVGDPVIATDADSDTLTYSIDDRFQDVFSIDSETGQLQTLVALDRETKRGYTLTVTASDGNGGSDSVTVRVKVTNDPSDDSPGGSPTNSILFTLMEQETLKTLDRDTLRTYLNALHAESDGSAKYARAIALIEGILEATRPKKTLLLGNYPNPFNPETWIPYQLANSSDVQIIIYNTRGTVVRQLKLGHQLEGYYTRRSRAAYWDGRNDIGERVASGIYFYQLQTDEVSLLRKMVILK